MKKPPKFIQMFLIVISLLLLAACGTTQNEEADAPADFTWTTDSEEARNLLLEGLAYQDVGDNVASRAPLNAAIEADPNFAIAYVFRSFSSGSNSEFKADSDKALALMEGTSYGEKMLIKINQTYLEGDNAGRLAMFKELTDSLPESARAWYFRAFDQSGRNGEEEQARANFRKAQALDPDWVGGYVGEGSSFLFVEPKDFDKAETLLTKAAELAPDYAFSHINLGDAYRAKNELQKAADSYTTAIELDSDNFIAYTKRGHAHSFLGNYDEARQDFRASRQYNEYGDQALGFEAFTYLYEGEVDKSLEWLEEQSKSLSESGMSEDRIQNGMMTCANICAWIAFHHGKTDHLDRFKEMRNSMNLEMTTDIGTEQADKNAKAGNAYWDGLTAAAKGDYETAMAKAEENKMYLEESTNPNKHYGYHFLMGYIHYQNGNYEEAESNFRKGNPNWVYRNYYLGKALKAAGKDAEGDELLAKVAMFNFNGVHYALIRNELVSPS